MATSRDKEIQHKFLLHILKEYNYSKESLLQILKDHPEELPDETETCVNDLFGILSGTPYQRTFPDEKLWENSWRVLKTLLLYDLGIILDSKTPERNKKVLETLKLPQEDFYQAVRAMIDEVKDYCYPVS